MSEEPNPVGWRYIPSDVWGDQILTQDPKTAALARKYGRKVDPLFTQAQMDAAVAFERERCAALCEMWNTSPGSSLAKEIRGGSEAGKPQAAPVADELGWLIEMRPSENLLWWDGGFDVSDDYPSKRLFARMVNDVNKAVRFSRREDAQCVLDAMLAVRPSPLFARASTLYSVQEHMWIAAQPQQATGEAAVLAKVQPVAWISVADRLPKSGLTVLACYKNRIGNMRRIRAQWIAAKSSEASMEYSDTAEYDEETDTYYDPEGWYERIDNCDDYSAVAVYEGDVTHWMPLPEAPAPQEGPSREEKL